MLLNSLLFYLPCNFEVLTTKGFKPVDQLQKYQDFVVGIELLPDSLLDLSEGIVRDITTIEIDKNKSLLIQTFDSKNEELYYSFALPKSDKKPFYIATFETLQLEKELAVKLSVITNQRELYHLCTLPSYIKDKQIAPLPFTKEEVHVYFYEQIDPAELIDYIDKNCLSLYQLDVSFLQTTKDSVILPLVKLSSEKVVPFAILSET